MRLSLPLHAPQESIHRRGPKSQHGSSILTNAPIPQGFTRESITWLATRYPVAVNTRETLEQLLKERTPPPPTVEQQVEHVTVSVEELVNIQAGIHAKLDLLIRMATL